MGDKSLLLGLDISTTGAKALLINGAGEVIGSATSPLTLLNSATLWSEQSPSDWWAGMAASIRSFARRASDTRLGDGRDRPDRTDARPGSVGPDREVLRPAILWNDRRTGRNVMRSCPGGERDVHPDHRQRCLAGFTAPKILWVKENEPEVYSQARHILLPKDYIRYRLTGDYAMDKADGSGTQLFDSRLDRVVAGGAPGARHSGREWLPPTSKALKLPVIVPSPPKRAVPPITTAAMTVSSAPAPAVGLTKPRWANCRAPANAAATAVKTKQVTLMRLTGMPDRRAAELALPVART